MIGESEDDVLAFFGDFARPVTWTPTGGDPTQIVGIFDEGTEAHDFSSQRSEVMVAQPTLRCPTFQVANVKRGDAFAFTDPRGTARTMIARNAPEREADGLTSVIYVRDGA